MCMCLRARERQRERERDNVCVHVYTRHQHFASMTGIFYVLLREHGDGTDTDTSQNGKSNLDKNILAPRLEPETF